MHNTSFMATERFSIIATQAQPSKTMQSAFLMQCQVFMEWKHPRIQEHVGLTRNIHLNY